jgi:bis(5'-nucleosyl)-tetraphosphatase (symmetrical)
MPWFEVPGRRSEATPIAFGHWSTLGRLDDPNLLALDTGCVWGGHLSAARIDGGRREIVSIACDQAQAPG